MTDTSVDALLQRISSSRIKDEVSNAYTEVGESLKEIGAPSNNMLLSYIHGETKRTGDEILRVGTRVSKLETHLSKICELLEKQNIILASMEINSSIPDDTGAISGKSIRGGEWWYQGTRLSSRYHVYSCIIFHLISMVQLQMDQKSIHYPDSVDCDFKTMVNSVRIVSTERCNIKEITYKNSITAKDKDDQGFGHIYPIISSKEKDFSTTMPESQLTRICNQVTRQIMQEVEWIRQRLCFLPGILSIKQIDILRSIDFPVVKAEYPDELNWNPREIKPKKSHPLASDIWELTKTQRDEYIKSKMKGKNTQEAFTIAQTYIPEKKTKA